MKSSIIIALGGVLLASNAAFGQSLKERYQHVVDQRVKAQSHNASKAHMLSVLLYTDLSLEYDQTPARDVFNHLKTVLGINLIARYNDDKTGVGIDPDTPITLNVENTAALTILEMVLSQCEDYEPCTWQLREGFVEVGPKTRLSAPAAQEVRYYPIRDLIFDPPRFDNAPSLDLEAALNQGGNFGGGGGGGGGFGGGGFGGGGSGGGGGGGGGGGAGGSIFGEPGDQPERVAESERAQQIVDIIQQLVEPDAWFDDTASIRYYQGTLIVRAPDYIQRQIGGYPFATSPVQRSVAAAGVDRRYVTFSGGASNVTNAGFREARQVGGSAGGSGNSGAGNATGGETNGGAAGDNSKP